MKAWETRPAEVRDEADLEQALAAVSLSEGSRIVGDLLARCRRANHRESSLDCHCRWGDIRDGEYLFVAVVGLLLLLITNTVYR